MFPRESYHRQSNLNLDLEAACILFVSAATQEWKKKMEAVEDVVIVGAGFACLTAALGLHRYHQPSPIFSFSDFDFYVEGV